QIDKILLKRQVFGPCATRPDGLEVLNAGHHGVIILYDVVDGQHSNFELLRFELFRNLELTRNERGCGLRHGWITRAVQSWLGLSSRSPPRCAPDNGRQPSRTPPCRRNGRSSGRRLGHASARQEPGKRGARAR